jgi:hypothetical protein
VPETCKQHVREKYRDQVALVEEFFAEFEGTGKNADLIRWGRFVDVRGIDKEMLQRLKLASEPTKTPSNPV